MIEKIWEYKSILCVVRVIGYMGHRCGYANIPYELYPKDVYEVEVHGGVTFEDESIPEPYLESIKGNWIGFDCSHAGDCGDPLYAENKDYIRECLDRGDHVWTLDEVVQETERMVDSIYEIQEICND